MEAGMEAAKQELSVMNRFQFERQPVGIKFSFTKPESLKQLGRDIALCEMLKTAQESESGFYVTPENQSCKPAASIWGIKNSGVFDSGQFGAAMKIFKEPRANVRLNQHIPKLDKEVVRYIAFAPLDKLSFTPDLIVVLTDKVSQTEILLRSMTYTTGEVWSSTTTVVAGCAWLLAYPYLTGRVNYIATGFGSGMKAKKLFPEGRHLISIPYNWIRDIAESLDEMPWVLPAWEAGDVREFIKGIHAQIGISS
jgi:uncharacterized protein (DUF169 family)